MAGLRALGYVRLSKEERQGNGGLGIAAQRAAIEAEVRRRGWSLVDIFEDVGWSGRTLRRPGIERILGMLRGADADVLVVAKLDRLTRRMADLVALVEETKRTRSPGSGRTRRRLPPWQLCPCDMPSVDTTQPAGAFTANMIGAAAQFEREMIAKRTRDALAVKKSRGERVGREPLVPEAVRARIVRLRKRGVGWFKIAETLNADGVPTSRGGSKWFPSTVKKVWQSAQYIAERERIARAAGGKMPKKTS